ncbi:MAG: hypothetical protein ACLS5Z_06560 [Clostridium fessum]
MRKTVAVKYHSGEGKTAQDKDTCCGSFDEKKGGTFRNLFKTLESRLEVGRGNELCL